MSKCLDPIPTPLQNPCTCANCFKRLVWDECSACDGEGGTDGYEQDPNWYHPGEIAQCSACGGSGGQWIHEDEADEDGPITFDDHTTPTKG